MATGGLKTWQYGTLVVSCIGSMLAGASVVHRIFPPDLSLPDTGAAASEEVGHENATRTSSVVPQTQGSRVEGDEAGPR